MEKIITKVNTNTSIDNKSKRISQLLEESNDNIKEYLVSLDKARTNGRPSKLTKVNLYEINKIQAKYNILTLKSLHLLLVEKYKQEFSRLPCYKNFVQNMNNFAKTLIKIIKLFGLMNIKTRMNLIIDASALPVCHIKREKRHKTMQFCSTKTYHPLHGWYYGLKLHLVVDYAGNIVDFLFTTAKTSDIEGFEIILKGFINKDYIGDAGYISKILQKKASLLNSTIMTKTRKNMKVLATKKDFKRYNKRKIIETAFGSLKENYNLVTSKCRSISGYIAHYIRALFQYQYCKKVNLKLKSRVS